MKLLKKLWLSIVLLPAAICGAQTLPIPLQFTYNGETFTVTTNAAGLPVVTATGTNGTATATTPTSPQQAAQEARAMIAANNPDNASFYGTNEIEAALGGAYCQNTGESAFSISVTKWGWVKQAPSLGFEACVLQGNKSGASGTAGAFGCVDYRKVIGDVAAKGGVGGGYDNWNAKPFALFKIGVEYRQNNHLGEEVGTAYCFEATKSDRALMPYACINYAF